MLSCVVTVPRPGATEIPSPSVTLPPPVATPIPSPTPEPTDTPEPSPTPEPTETPTPTLPPATPTQTPSATDTPGGPVLAVYAPEDGAVVPGDSVVVYGQTEPGARVFISGTEAEVDSEGGFRADVFLEPGENSIEIAAANGGRSQVSRRVTSLALPFLLLITEPESESVVDSPQLPLSGRTGPNAIVSINGRSVPVDRFGYFSTTMLLVQGPNIIDVVATNEDGETRSQVVAVIYRPASE